MTWSEVPLRSLYQRVDESGRPDLPLLSVYRDYGVVPREGREDNYNKPSADLSGYKVVQRYDLVINKMKAWQGSLAVSDYGGIVSPAYFVGRPIGDADHRFVHHLLRSSPLIAEYGARSKGIRPSQWDLPWNEFASIRVRIPTFDTQRRLASHLDTETARIDALISKTHRLFKLLEEQDLRTIDDLFDDVLNNRLTRLGYVADVRSGVTLAGVRPRAVHEVTVPYLRVANVQHDHLDLREVKTVTVDWATAQRTMLHSGDVLMTEGGDIDKLGRGTVWRGEIDPCLHQNHVFAVRVRTPDLLPEYLALVTRTSYARRYFEMTGVRSTNLASTNASKVADFRIPYPSRDVQSAIVRKYKHKWEALDKARTALSLQLDLLAERRQSLITAVVTGQMQVPSAAT